MATRTMMFTPPKIDRGPEPRTIYRRTVDNVNDSKSLHEKVVIYELLDHLIQQALHYSSDRLSRRDSR